MKNLGEILKEDPLMLRQTSVNCMPRATGICRRRIELVQDLEFPAACHRLKLTLDGEYLFATGIHPPRVRHALTQCHTPICQCHPQIALPMACTTDLPLYAPKLVDPRRALCVQVRVYELGQLSLKFERHFDAEIIDFQVSFAAPAFSSAIHDALAGPERLTECLLNSY